MKYNYPRKVLFRNKECEVILIDWKPGVWSPIHEHGRGCRGVIIILQGTVKEFTYRRKGRRLIQNGKAMILSKGMVAEEKELGIHQIGNPVYFPAQTLHIYFPRAKNKEIKLT